MIDFIVDILKNLIEIDTRTTLNNETQAANYIKDICSKFGIWTEVIESIPGKGNVIAYLPGKDLNKENVLLLSHLDTDEFGELSKWVIKPNSGIQYENKIFGRGAIDCKGLVSLWLSILIFYKTNNMKPERGIVFAAVADEENGGMYGSEFLLKTHELIKMCKYVIGEGGGIPIRIGKKVYYTCQNSEKGELTYLIKDNCIKKFIGSTYYDRVKLTSLCKGIVKYRLYNMKLAVFLLKQYLNKNTNRRIDWRELLLNSVSFSEEKDGCKLVINYLPYTPRKYIEDSIEKRFGIKLSNAQELDHVKPNYTSVKTDIFKIIKRELEKQLSDTIIIPYMTPGYSDNRFFRETGKIVYGFFPLDINNGISGIHGYNEYISIESLEMAFNLMKEVIWKIAISD